MKARVYLPVELHRRLKARAALRGDTLAGYLETLLSYDWEEHELEEFQAWCMRRERRR